LERLAKNRESRRYGVPERPHHTRRFSKSKLHLPRKMCSSSPRQTVASYHISTISRASGSSIRRTRYTEDFWDASNRLKLHDRIAREQSELNDVNVRRRSNSPASLRSTFWRAHRPLRDHQNLGGTAPKRDWTFVRLGRSPRRSRRGPQRQELQLLCAEHLCALRICDLEGIHGDLRAWRPRHFCHSLELKITFKVDVCGAHV
jgi:hypothetical protein